MSENFCVVDYIEELQTKQKLSKEDATAKAWITYTNLKRKERKENV